MSVSLRERVAETIAELCSDNFCYGCGNKIYIKVEEIEKYTDQILALIGKCATPTFSGGEIRQGKDKETESIPTEKKCEHKWDGQGYWCLLCGSRNPDTLKPVVKEKKEYCGCGNKIDLTNMSRYSTDTNGNYLCNRCGKIIEWKKGKCEECRWQGMYCVVGDCNYSPKPIPAEKKECEHELNPCPFCGEEKQLQVQRIDFKNPERDLVKCRICRGEAPRGYWNKTNPEPKIKECEHKWEKGPINHPDWCRKCGEPKPKDRIEPLTIVYEIENTREAQKINELIQWINKQK